MPEPRKRTFLLGASPVTLLLPPLIVCPFSNFLRRFSLSIKFLLAANLSPSIWFLSILLSSLLILLNTLNSGSFVTPSVPKNLLSSIALCPAAVDSSAFCLSTLAALARFFLTLKLLFLLVLFFLKMFV